MKKSVLMQRVFLMVIAALLTTALCTTAIYTLMSRSLFASLKTSEMMPKARALSYLVAVEEGKGSQSAEPILNVLKKDDYLLGGYFLVTDTDGRVLARSDALEGEVSDSLKPLITRVLTGEEVSVYSGQSVSQVQMVCVGVPFRRSGEIRGTVFLFVPIYEAIASANALSSALVMSMLIVMPLVIALLYLFIGRITRPLRQMRDAAIAMASGDFGIQADADQRGEIGQLASSLNHLSRELSHNLSELTIERNRLRQSVDGLHEGFVSVDATGRIMHSNPAVTELFSSVDRGDRLSLIPDQSVWDAFDNAISRGESAVRDIAVSDHMIRAAISPVTDENHHTVGAVGLFTDITESERLERTRRDYVANVSHELRTPLTALRGLIEPLRDGMVRSDEARTRYYDIILRETMRLSRLIDDLMELSRLQSGKLSLEVRPVVLHTIIEDLSEKYTAAAAEKKQTFRLLKDPSVFPNVITNPDRVEQILVILLDNAMKYTGENGVISLDLKIEDDRARLFISDTGVGIDQDDLPYVFDRFYKADKSRRSAGSGLGLSIAREILQQMGETISVTSEKGKGSTFSFTLRLDKKDPQ